MESESLKKDTVKTKNTERPENVCPVCKIGPFQGGHQCIACKRMVHIFCGEPIGEEGFGQKILCNDCQWIWILMNSTILKHYFSFKWHIMGV